MSDGMKVALYVRVSTGRQEVQNQLVDLRSYCEQHGHTIVGEYVDVMSGASRKRPGFARLFDDAHRGLFGILIFWDLSRFSRSGTLYTLQKLKELDNLNICWHSYSEPYFSSVGEFRDVVLSIMATLARIERERISLRTKAGLRRAVNVGKRGKDKRPRRRRSDRGIPRRAKKERF